MAWNQPVIHPEHIIAVRRRVQELFEREFEGRPATPVLAANWQYVLDLLNEAAPWQRSGWRMRGYFPLHHEVGLYPPRVTLHNDDHPAAMAIQVWPALPEFELVELMGKPL